MNFLYKNWARMCFPLALAVTLILVFSLGKISWVVFLIWLQFPVYLLHESEEHFWPGGFQKFFNQEIFHSAKPDVPLTDTMIFWVNILAIWTVFPLCAVLAQTQYLALGLFLPIFGLFDATIHIVMGGVKRKYNPGLAASLFLNYPTGIYTLYVMHRLQLLTAQMLAYSIAWAFLAHAGIMIFVAHRRAKLKIGSSPE